jgi:hypothetical protein
VLRRVTTDKISFNNKEFEKYLGAIVLSRAISLTITVEIPRSAKKMTIEAKAIANDRTPYSSDPRYRVVFVKKIKLKKNWIIFEANKKNVFLAILWMGFTQDHLNASPNQSQGLPQRSSFRPLIVAGTIVGSFQGRLISSGFE